MPVISAVLVFIVMLVIRTLLASDCYESDNRALSFDCYASKRTFLLLMVMPISALPPFPSLSLLFFPKQRACSQASKRAFLLLMVKPVISALLDLIFTPVRSVLLVLTVMLVISALLV